MIYGYRQITYRRLKVADLTDKSQFIEVRRKENFLDGCRTFIKVSTIVELLILDYTDQHYSVIKTVTGDEYTASKQAFAKIVRILDYVMSECYNVECVTT